MHVGLAAAGGSRFAAELLLAQLAEPGGFLLFSLDARLLVMFAAAGFSEDAVLLDALVEALECAFERFVITDDDFGQEISPRLLAWNIALSGAPQSFTVPPDGRRC